MSDAIREQIVKVAKLMYEKGMVKPSGICKGFLKEDMIVKTDMNGNILEGMYKPSSETYKKRKDIYSVVHAHPPYTTAYAVANKPIESKACAEMVIFFCRRIY